MSKNFLGIASLTVFIVTFKLGYVFHDLLLGEWFHQQEAEIAREHFIIPLLAVAFMVYAILLAYLFPIYRKYYANSKS